LERNDKMVTFPFSLETLPAEQQPELRAVS
jgi:hypothetical protein